ncbi:MAG TPA: response regulator transcription factor [Candidatus Krumholzibacteria bacterium]|nr:response regulator transcription factor [Candidatus Krumholzibacteria bacterium]
MARETGRPFVTRIMLIDDHAVLRGALAGLLSGLPEFRVVADYGTVHEALGPAAPEPDVIVQDVSLPEVGGLAALPLLRQRFPQARVLMLSMHPVEVFGLRAIRAGAHGYLTKEASPDELADAIRRVAAGRRVIPDELAEILATAADPHATCAPHETLSDREHAVLVRLAAGARVSDIADEMHLSVKTVSTYRRRILDKMQLESTADLVRYALEHELLTR